MRIAPARRAPLAPPGLPRVIVMDGFLVPAGRDSYGTTGAALPRVYPEESAGSAGAAPVVREGSGRRAIRRRRGPSLLPLLWVACDAAVILLRARPSRGRARTGKLTPYFTNLLASPFRLRR